MRKKISDHRIPSEFHERLYRRGRSVHRCDGGQRRRYRVPSAGWSEKADGSVPLISQDAALEYTKERLEKSGLAERAVLIRDGHERMGYYVKEEVAAIMFNFGYLPGADHAVATKAETSLAAIRCGYGIAESRRRDESLHLQRRRHRIRGADCAAWFFKNVGSKAVACTCA